MTRSAPIAWLARQPAVIWVLRYRATIGLVVGIVAIVAAMYTLGHVVFEQKTISDRILDARTSGRQTTCNTQNTLAQGNNGLIDELEQLVLVSTQQTRVQEPIYKKLGLPSYAQRLAQAKAYNARLERRKITLLDCKRYVREPYSIRQRR